MTILCSQCGTTLPTDDARFCNNCGTVVASLPLSPQSLSVPEDLSTPPMEPSRQPAYQKIQGHSVQPPPRPTQRSHKDEVPAWTNQPGKGGTKDITPKLIRMPEEAPTAILSIPVIEHPTSETESNKSLQDKHSDSPSPSQLSAPEHELQNDVKEKDEEDSPENHPTMLLELPPLQAPEQPDERKEKDEEDSLENHPTMLLELPPLQAPEQPDGKSVQPLESVIQEASDLERQDHHVDHIEHIDTIHLPVQALPSTPIPEQLSNVTTLTQEKEPLHPSKATVSSLHQYRKYFPVKIVGILFCILALSGIGTWLYLLQPFSVPAVTQPNLSFKDTTLGISLLYPNGWISQIDRSQSIVHFYDSSHTAQVNIMVTPNNGTDLTQYLALQAKQLGMTATKSGAPLTFAGASWQQIQGTIQQSGANYTCVILVTVYHNRIFTLTQQAHQSVYVDEEHIAFSPLRTSLQFA